MTTPDQQRAREVAISWVGWPVPALVESIAQALTAVRDEARREQREQDAKIVEGSTEYDTSNAAVNFAIRNGMTKAIAAAIRGQEK